MMPAVPEACPSLKRLGNPGDGGKILCGIENIPNSAAKPCIVYSIGSNNQWDFEHAIVEATSCIVHTFDCTVVGQVPQAIEDRVTFHSICLGKASENSTGDFKSLKAIMAMLGHEHITLLKADIVCNPERVKTTTCYDSNDSYYLLFSTHTISDRKVTSGLCLRAFCLKEIFLFRSKSHLSSTIRP
jgi:hypothetical protein